jgi:hypothetical protein
MKALRVQDLPSGDWLYEMKFDGYRFVSSLLPHANSGKPLAFHFRDDFGKHVSQKILTVRQPPYCGPHPLVKILLQRLLTKAEAAAPTTVEQEKLQRRLLRVLRHQEPACPPRTALSTSVRLSQRCSTHLAMAASKEGFWSVIHRAVLRRISDASLSRISRHIGLARMAAISPSANSRLKIFQLFQKQRCVQK